ncbi:hypothetical protein GCM10027440_28190 [Nocardiopsis coralliicola]
MAAALGAVDADDHAGRRILTGGVHRLARGVKAVVVAVHRIRPRSRVTGPAGRDAARPSPDEPTTAPAGGTGSRRCVRAKLPAGSCQSGRSTGVSGAAHRRRDSGAAAHESGKKEPSPILCA